MSKLSSDKFSYSITEDGNKKTIVLRKENTVKVFTLYTSTVERLTMFMDSMTDVTLDQIIK